MSSCAEVEVESPFVLPRMKSKQMLPGNALSLYAMLITSIALLLPLKGELLVRVHLPIRRISDIPHRRRTRDPRLETYIISRRDRTDA